MMTCQHQFIDLHFIIFLMHSIRKQLKLTVQGFCGQTGNNNNNNINNNSAVMIIIIIIIFNIIIVINIRISPAAASFRFPLWNIPGLPGFVSPPPGLFVRLWPRVSLKTR